MKSPGSAGRKITLLSVFLLPVIWAAMVFAQSYSPDFSQLISNLTQAMNHPFDPALDRKYAEVYCGFHRRISAGDRHLLLNKKKLPAARGTRQRHVGRSETTIP